jgi:hypothetical protein
VNKRKKVAWRKHRVKRKKELQKRKQQGGTPAGRAS